MRCTMLVYSKHIDQQKKHVVCDQNADVASHFDHPPETAAKSHRSSIIVGYVRCYNPNSLIEPENNNAFSKSEIETQMQRQEEKVDMREAVNAGLVVTKSKYRSSNENTFAEVQLTALHNILANEQQHTEQSEPNYDTHLLETIDSNTTPTSTNMCHRGGEIDQDALLNAELLKTKDMVCMEVYNELSKRFLQLEKHCISLEISIQQKEESFHSNKPCKNKEYPEFREFFVINDLKAQLQAKTTLICDLKNQIKSVKEASNEAKVKNDIDSIENADLKAQIQEKVFANAALKNELRKLKGNIVDSKFAKASILGKPPLQPTKKPLLVRESAAAEPHQSLKIRNNNPVEPKNHTHKPGRQIGIGQRFSLNKSSAMHEKPHTPRSCLRWKPTGTSIQVQKLQKNPIFHISVDISRTQTSLGHSLHQQIPFYLHSAVLGTSTHDAKTGRSLLHDNIVPKPDLALELGKSISLTEAEEEAVAREVHATHARIIKALAITPVIPAQPFELPSSGNTVIDFVNELGYPEPVEIVSNIRVNYVYQPWRAILTLINQCLTGKTSGFVPKGETVEVFGMAILDPLITEAIQQSLYYLKYLEIVAKNTKKTPQESASEQLATKHAPPKKPTTTTLVKPSPALTKKPSKSKLPQKVRKGKPTFQLVDEDDEAQ
ncbi:hypothetical protein Tco_0326561 [Tanacetum coccineum]